jgi:hypothetical protein
MCKEIKRIKSEFKRFIVSHNSNNENNIMYYTSQGMGYNLIG